MKNRGKLLLFSLLAFAMVMLFAGCGTKTAEGQITSIDGTTLTVSLGEMAEQSDEEMSAPTDENGEAPTPPDNDESTDGNSSDADSDNSTTDSDDTAATDVSVDGNDTTAADTATDSEDTTTNSDNTTDDSTTTPPDQPEGDVSGSGGEEPPDMGDKEAPADMESSGNGFFTASGETMTFDASNVTITLSDGSEGTVDDLAVNDIISITYSGDSNVSAITVEMSMNMGGAPGGDTAADENESIDLTGAYTVDGEEKTISGDTYTSEASDENAILVTNSGILSASDITVTKTGDTSSADNSNFYGLNAAIAAAGGSTLTLSGADISTDSEGSNAIFSTGDGSAITVSDTTIHTTGNSARGLDATYNGTIDATNMTITTEGDHCAPVATDRGEGTITITDSTLSAAGDGSPCIYSTGDITAENVTGTATGSQAAVIEGKNAITLTNCDLTGAGENGVMLYQSTSGDAAEGTSVLTATDSTLSTTSDGPMFYITNTDAKIVLNNTTLDFSSGILLNASGNNTNNWGEEGNNGGDVTLNAKYQTLTGDILCDDISSVTLNVGYNSTYEGTINGDNSGGSVVFNLGKTATLTLTGDSYVSVFTDNDENLSNIVSNGYTLYYDADNEDNAWLDGQTITLDDGGTIAPM